MSVHQTFRGSFRPGQLQLFNPEIVADACPAREMKKKRGQDKNAIIKEVRCVSKCGVSMHIKLILSHIEIKHAWLHASCQGDASALLAFVGARETLGVDKPSPNKSKHKGKMWIAFL